ncbi:MAG TPA: hypothetical protein VMZ53_34095 [Kofleriaceae bacterium]|nr:hypothetical protein [Kofleriaceae bacterium]
MRFGVAFVLVCLVAGQVAAQPAAAQAEALFRQGKQLMDAGKTAEACKAFEASQKAEAAVSTLLNLANCREKNGELATAWGLFLDVARQTRAATDAAGKQFNATANQRASNIEHRLSHLTVGVSDNSKLPQLEVVRDGVAVDAGSWNRRLPIDGGKHTIVARAPGHKPWTITIDVASHDDDRQVEVPPLPEAEQAIETPTPRAETSRASSGHTGAWVLTATTLALAGGAIGFDLWARDTYDKTLVAGDPDLQTALWKSANRKRYVADGFAVGAIGCGVAAIWLFARGGSGSTTTAHIEPVATPESTGFALVGGW